MSTRVLVIGFGNVLRGDDGIGVTVAREVAGMEMPDVEVMVVHQLTPELAADLASVRVAIFVDASVNEEPVATLNLSDPAVSLPTTHFSDPCWLLWLVQTVYGESPEAWKVTVGGADFSFREGLSAVGRENADQARDRVVRLIQRIPQ